MEPPAGSLFPPPAGSLLHRKPSPVPPASNVTSCPPAFSFSSSSAASGEMEELPFSLEDLPPEIRDKIDDIIEKNEDLESQLEAIDELLFADRLFAKFESGTKYDIGSESGIGSDSDSGNGITPSTDPLRNSSAATTSLRPAGEDTGIDPRTFGPLLLRSTPLQPDHDVDYLISRLIVPAPPPPAASPTPSSSSIQREATNLAPRFHPTPASSSLPPTVGYQLSSPSKPTARNGDGMSMPPAPPEFQTVNLGKESRATDGTNLKSLDVPPHDSRSTPSPDPSQERISNLSRTPAATKWEGKTSSGPAAGRILKNNNRISMNVETELSSLSSSNTTRQKGVSLSRSSSRTELYAWGDVPGIPTSSKPVVRSPKPINSEKSVPAIDSDTRRNSQPSSETSRKSKLFLRKDETEPESVGGARTISNGSTVDLRRNKWGSVAEILPRGNAEVSGGRGGGGRRRDAISDDEEGSDLENAAEDAKKGGPSPVEDNFSNLVRLREKNGKPAQMVRINHRTLKAQSMLSLYDPSSDAKEKENAKKSNKKEPGSDSRKRLSTFLQRKLKFYKKSSNDGTTARQSYERTDLTNGVISRADSETELHRSDYLSPNVSSVPARYSIPSPSLYSSLDNKNGNNLQRVRPRSEGPGHISEIFRIDSRDLNVDDDRPRLTFDTFRGQIEPIRWSDEKTKLSGTNGATMTTNGPSLVSPEQPLVPSLAVNMSASNGNKPIHLNTSNGLHLTNDHNNSRYERFDEKQSTNNIRDKQSDNSVVKKGVPTSTLPVIKQAMLPVSKPLRSQGNVTGRFAASCTSVPQQQATHANGVSPRIFANGLGDSVDRRNMPPSDPQPGFSNTNNYDPEDGRSSGHQKGNSMHHATIPDAVFSTNNSQLPRDENTKNNNVSEYRNYSEERRVLKTSYDDTASACDRAVLDARRTLSSLLADRERILSAASSSTSAPSVALYRTRKEQLAANCRQLVTDVKLMVAGATRSRRDLIAALTAVMHTFAGVFEACRLTVDALPTADGRRRRRTLVDEVLKLGDVFLDTLSSGCVAAGRRQDDPSMELLMYHTTEMARSLGRLLNTIRSLDG